MAKIDLNDPQIQDAIMYAAKGHARDRVAAIVREQPSITTQELLLILQLELDDAVTNVERNLDRDDT